MTSYQIKLPNNSTFNFDLNPGEIVIDCGANIGIYTNMFASSGAKVYAFEPDPNAFSVLKEATKSNFNIKIYQKAVGIREEKLKLYFHKESKKNPIEYSQGSSLLHYKGNVDKENFAEVEVIDLGNFINSLEQSVKILKIDIEGAEVELINNLLERNILQKIPYVFIETHDNKIPELADETNRIRKFILDNNFSNIRLDWV